MEEVEARRRRKGKSQGKHHVPDSSTTSLSAAAGSNYNNRHTNASPQYRYYAILLIVLLVATAVWLTGNVRYESQETILSQLLFKAASTTENSPNDDGTTAAVVDPTRNTTQTQQSLSSSRSCSDYDGVLLISLGPKLAAAGTILFQYVINQLLYAEKHNLQPWIYLSSTLRFIYDDKVHAGVLQVQHMDGMVVSWTNQSYPGPPVLAAGGVAALQRKEFSFSGDGIWNHYFEAVSNYNPTTISSDSSNNEKERQCYQKQPLLQMTAQHVKPGFHKDCPYAVRSWRYGDLPPHISQPSLSYKDWYWPMRQRGHAMVMKYIRFRPLLVQAAQQANPTTTKPDNCLALHVRHSDKSAERRVVSLQEFVPYLDAYQRAGGQHVYVATDSVTVLDELQNSTTLLTLHSQQNIVRSKDRTAVFKQTDSHDRTNVEVLVDILALSHCSFFLHGRSAVSEAVFYLNLDLHDASVDLEDDDRYTTEDFERVVRTKLKETSST
mmetsp:Transcript_18223/g.30229  ORF Transcript_18223/g.30229 Transcript_18223/m.30229 type:complete len:494 (+) Transcript_18223:116-1597(+)